MKAVRIHRYGGTEVLQYEDVPPPVLGEDEVLIRVYAASVNPLDWKLRAGIAQLQPPHSFPAILGFDVAGVIEDLGAGVKHFALGDQVYATSDFGGYAELVAVNASEVAYKPRALSYIEAAAMPIAVVTAWQVLFEGARLEAGQSILIHGAAGGVGHFAVQFAKMHDAQVIGTASGPNQLFLRRLGVDQPIDYTTTRFEEVIAGVDVVLDLIGGETQQASWTLLKPGGLLISIVDPPDPGMAQAYGVRQQMFNIQSPVAPLLAQLASLVDAGQLKPTVSALFPLEQAHLAHALIEKRHVQGKIVLQVVS